MTKSPSPRTNATPEEKLATLLNDKRVLRQQRDTFNSRAAAEANQIQGRFAQHEKATVVGSATAAQYPKLPDGSFSNQGAVVPPEEPLGFSVEEVPIVGEPGEVAASIDRLERAAQEASPTSSLDADGPRVGAAGSDAAASSQRIVEPPLTQSPTPTGLGDPTPLGVLEKEAPDD